MARSKTFAGIGTDSSCFDSSASFRTASGNTKPLRTPWNGPDYSLHVLLVLRRTGTFLRDQTRSIMYRGRLSESRRRVGRSNPAAGPPVRAPRRRRVGRVDERARGDQRADGSGAEHG